MHWGECEQEPSEPTVAVERDDALGGVPGGVLLGDGQVGVASDVREGSATPGELGKGRDDSESRMLRFASSIRSDFCVSDALLC